MVTQIWIFLGFLRLTNGRAVLVNGNETQYLGKFPYIKTSNDQRVNREKQDEKLIRGSWRGENTRYE